jgi:hypothetical protein
MLGVIEGEHGLSLADPSEYGSDQKIAHVFVTECDHLWAITETQARQRIGNIARRHIAIEHFGACCRCRLRPIGPKRSKQ